MPAATKIGATIAASSANNNARPSLAPTAPAAWR